ncbi:hypothetical protein DYB32_004484 [Aphanomyces invadans]|uniref:WD40 repeat-containing protein SMU1 n=1 Tax=Aphanomyces invadans TaxID=157072 RepID=A0A418AXD2_9STRA|nr:hypothetical protein DYB32_004484 [Aphanomyces invadans]
MEIASEDVIRLMQQFLREHKLFDTLHTLQQESQVTLQAVDSVDALARDIALGKWDQVLTQTQHLHLSTSFMIDLYEQIVLELTEADEGSVALELLRQAPPLLALQERDITRYGHLERITRLPSFDARFAYSGIPKEKRREELAKKVHKYVTSVPPSRLLTLLGQALKYQELTGVLPDELDLFQNAPKRLQVDRTEESISKGSGKIKFGKASTPQTAQFSVDGRMLVSGTKDGFVEAWDFDKCVLRKDLEYQARIWDVKSAECLSTLRPPHASPGVEMDVLGAVQLPHKPTQLVLVTRSKAMYLVSWQGEFTTTTYTDPYTDLEPKGDFVAAVTSPQGKFLYALTDKGFVLCFKTDSGVLDHAMQVCSGTVHGIAHHPHRNVLATYGSDGYVRIWKA